MYLDVDILLALIKEKDFHKSHAEEICSLEEEKYTSVISLLELEIVIKREISNEMSLQVSDLVSKAVPNIKIKECNKHIFEASINLRKTLGLGIFDSIHAATALEFDKRMASTDNVYKRIKNLTVL